LGSGKAQKRKEKRATVEKEDEKPWKINKLARETSGIIGKKRNPPMKGAARRHADSPRERYP